MTPGWLRRERPKAYREQDFRRRIRYRDDYLALAAHLVDLLEFESVYDVGCANGFLLEGFQAAGSWELVCCVEVAEHIEPARSRELVGTLTRLSNRWIYFTAAPPGQAGRGHINCRPHAEWLGWLGEAGWRCDRPRTDRLRERLSTLTLTTWLRQNSFVLSRQAGSDT